MSNSSSTGAPSNVIVVLTDQQRWDSVGCYGSPMDLTPNLDAAARQGVRFEHAFTCQPVCAPARACLQTGRYAAANGVFRNGLLPNPGERMIAEDFKEHGYEVGYIGKWHLGGSSNKPVPAERRGGYVDHWEAADLLEFTSHPYDTRLFDANDQEIHVEGYRVDATTDLALRFLDRPHQDPFFLFLSYLEPHHQNDENRFVAPDGYAARYANPWIPEDLIGRPGDWPSQLPDYYGIIARIDECLGRILARLESRGLAENTVVLFTSDHGCHFRSRNNEYKRSCHESSIRVPSVLWGAGIPRGVVVRELVSLIDVPPTLLDVAGVPVPERMHGRSLLPLARGEEENWRNEVFIQLSEVEVARTIRTPRWKYTAYAPDKDPWNDGGSDVYRDRSLYDLRRDPHERVNLVGRQDHEAIVAPLRERLITRMLEADETQPEIIPEKFPAG